MSPKDTSESPAVLQSLSKRDLEVLVLGLYHLTCHPQINYDEMISDLGVKSKQAAQNAFRNAMKKVNADYVALGGKSTAGGGKTGEGCGRHSTAPRVKGTHKLIYPKVKNTPSKNKPAKEDNADALEKEGKVTAKTKAKGKAIEADQGQEMVTSKLSADLGPYSSPSTSRPTSPGADVPEPNTPVAASDATVAIHTPKSPAKKRVAENTDATVSPKPAKRHRRSTAEVEADNTTKAIAKAALKAEKAQAAEEKKTRIIQEKAAAQAAAKAQKAQAAEEKKTKAAEEKAAKKGARKSVGGGGNNEVLTMQNVGRKLEGPKMAADQSSTPASSSSMDSTAKKPASISSKDSAVERADSVGGSDFATTGEENSGLSYGDSETETEPHLATPPDNDLMGDVIIVQPRA